MKRESKWNWMFHKFLAKLNPLFTRRTFTKSLSDFIPFNTICHRLHTRHSFHSIFSHFPFQLVFLSCFPSPFSRVSHFYPFPLLTIPHLNLLLSERAAHPHSRLHHHSVHFLFFFFHLSKHSLISPPHLFFFILFSFYLENKKKTCIVIVYLKKQMPWVILSLVVTYVMLTVV